MDKKLLKVKGGYINNPELVNNMNKILIKTIFFAIFTRG